MLTPAFHFQILESFFDVFNDRSQTLIEDLIEASEVAKKNDTDLSSSGKGVPINVYTILTQCALDIICGKEKCVFLFWFHNISCWAPCPTLWSGLNHLYEQCNFGFLNAFVPDSSMGQLVRKKEETQDYLRSLNRYCNIVTLNRLSIATGAAISLSHFTGPVSHNLSIKKNFLSTSH